MRIYPHSLPIIVATLAKESVCKGYAVHARSAFGAGALLLVPREVLLACPGGHPHASLWQLRYFQPVNEARLPSFRRRHGEAYRQAAAHLSRHVAHGRRVRAASLGGDPTLEEGDVPIAFRVRFGCVCATGFIDCCSRNPSGSFGDKEWKAATTPRTCTVMP